MRRMITRLIIAQLIPVGIRVVKKAFNKRKPGRVQSHDTPDNLDMSPDTRPIETSDVSPAIQPEVSDQGVR